MSYAVKIRNNETGEIRTVSMDGEWDEGQLWYWTEGNFGCDCNRHLEFVRAGGSTPTGDDWAVQCSTGRYTAIGIDDTLDAEVVG